MPAELGPSAEGPHGLFVPRSLRHKAPSGAVQTPSIGIEMRLSGPAVLGRRVPAHGCQSKFRANADEVHFSVLTFQRNTALPA